MPPSFYGLSRKHPEVIIDEMHLFDKGIIIKLLKFLKLAPVSIDLIN